MLRRIFAASLLLCFAATGAFAQTSGETAVSFPIIIEAPEELQVFGLAHGIDAPPEFVHHCYYYGDGGATISVTHERLERYMESGFTLNSLCMGLVSETLFDPETGARLPTYASVIDPDGMPVLDGYEHPIELPACYARALPYSDCTFRFDRLTGQKLSEDMTERYRALGAIIDANMHLAMERGWVCWWPDCVERDGNLFLNPNGGATSYLPGFFESQIQNSARPLPDDHRELAGLSLYDVSLNLPAGYGYTTDADGTAGPMVSAEMAAASADQSHRLSQIDPGELARLIVEARPRAQASATKTEEVRAGGEQ